MNAKFYLQHVRQSALSRLVYLRDWFLFSDNPLFCWKAWPVQSSREDLNDKVFFVLGSPRSGTTLLRRILSSHPQVFIPPENGGLATMIRTYGTFRWKSWNLAVQRVFDKFCTGYEFEKWEIDLKVVRKAAESIAPEDRSLAEIFNVLYTEYGLKHDPGKIRWGDKTTPGYFNYLRKLQMVFPKARFIHIVRDGRDCVASSIDAGFFDKNIEEAARAWKYNVKECRKLGRRIQNENRYHELRYEDLINLPKEKIDALCCFLDLEPDSDMMESLGSNHCTLPDVPAIGHHKNVQKPIFQDSVGKWKHKLPESEIEKVSGIIAQELAFYGYDTE